MEAAAASDEAAADAPGVGAASCGWSWEENKLFEMALAAAVVEEGDPERYWERVAAMIGGGGKKSPEEVKRHYEDLLEDLHSIESGGLDHELSTALVLHDDDVAAAAVGVAAPCWTDGDQEYTERRAVCRARGDKSTTPGI